MIIRRLWIQVSPTFGRPPILVLSYKNHAIDEFLVDLLTAEPTIRKDRLIRIGGGSAAAELLPFTEKSNQIPEVGMIAEQLKKIHSARINLKYVCTNYPKMLLHIDLLASQNGASQNISDAEAEEFSEKVEELVNRSYQLLTFYGIPTDSQHISIPDSPPIIETDKSANLQKREKAIKIFENANFFESFELPNLVKGIIHYPEYKSSKKLTSKIILKKWVSGFIPLPPCYIGGCPNLVLPPSRFCTRHRCKFDIPGKSRCEEKTKVPDQYCVDHTCLYDEKCVEVKTDKSNYCDSHRCAVGTGIARCTEKLAFAETDFCSLHCCTSAGCEASRLAYPQVYCGKHACYICLEQNSDKKAQEATARHTCQNHRLCNEMIRTTNKLCTALAMQGKVYCATHYKIQCRFLDENKMPACKTMFSPESPDIILCPAHRLGGVKKANTPVVIQTGVGGKCQGKNKRKKPCGAQALPKRRYCKDHLDQDEVGLEESDTNAVSLAAIIQPEIPDKHPEKLPDKLPENLQKIPTTTADIAPNVTTSTVVGPPIFDTTPKPESTDKKETDEAPQDKPLPPDAEEFFDCEETPFNDNPDEIEDLDAHDRLLEVFDVDEEDEEEEALKKEIEVDDRTDLNDNGNKADLQLDVKFTPVSSKLDNPKFWTWEMPLAQRLFLLRNLISIDRQLILWLDDYLSQESKEAFYQYHNAKVRSNTMVYEGKEVIGGTVVACVTRLEAIKRTKPFAIVIEEASEVLEPLLFACFTQNTFKLEMIGDHLQLQPSVQDKFDFERQNKMKYSLFERLVRAPEKFKVQLSVLSVQRRMRKNICDFTRDFYKGITTIQDHSICHTKTIGGARVSQKKRLIDKSSGEGREVPGILPHIYFWTHEGAQTQARVGLSRINEKEAQMAAALTDYLILCGVPKPSIAILTPYKGQLKLLQDKLKNHLPPREKAKPNTPKHKKMDHIKNADAIRISTVDRFQGDESDIVIISLVVDEKSSTGFVQLVNRMIVLLSRARLGMYIIGNVSYFEKANSNIKHWSETIQKLNIPAISDSSSKIDVYNGIRIGKQLPLCCPKHRNSKKNATTISEVKLDFCTQLCTKLLRQCGHQCGLPCHWVERKTHNQKCQQKVTAPCHLHPKTFECYNFTQRLTLKAAMDNYKCSDIVRLSYPCGHSTKHKCHEAHLYVRTKSFPDCVHPAANAFMYATCGHTLAVTCSEFTKFTNNTQRPPLCKQIVQYNPKCGHTIDLPCHKKQAYETGSEKFVCDKKNIVATLPRCGHRALLPCTEVQKLTQWSGASCKTFNRVMETDTYGPKENITFECTQPVAFEKRCGHEKFLPCGKAFKEAQDPEPCVVSIEINNPICGHKCTLYCYENSLLVVLPNKAPVMMVDDTGTAFGQHPLFEKKPCTVMLHVKRSCGHFHQMPCFNARKPPPCTELVEIPSPLCGHKITVPCNISKPLKSWLPWDLIIATNKQYFVNAITKQQIDERMQIPIPKEFSSFVLNCKQEVIWLRTLSCGHELKMMCGSAFSELPKVHTSRLVPKCDIIVHKPLKCNHEHDLICNEYMAYLDNSKTITCNTSTLKNCCNFKSCRHQVSLPCWSTETPVCSEPSDWKCNEGHSFNIKQCSEGVPNFCPSCDQDIVKSTTTELLDILENNEILEPSILPQISLDFATFFSLCNAKLLTDEDIRNFITGKHDNLHSYDIWLSSVTLWARYVFFW